MFDRPQLSARQAKAYRTSLILLVVVTVGSSCFRKPAQTAAQHSAPSTTLQRTLPRQTGLINDFADAFNPEQEQRLEQLVAQLKDVEVDFPIVTVETTSSEPLFDYSLALARDWRPGGPKGRGLLLVLAIKDRQWRLQVSEALRAELPDEVCLELGKPSEDFYRQRKYAEGVERYVRAISDRLRSSK